MKDKEKQKPSVEELPPRKEIPLEVKNEYLKRLRDLWRHIDNVRESAKILCERLVDEGELDLARRISERCYQHDVSKFSGLEWELLTFKRDEVDDKELFDIAIKEHHSNNPHHPEFFLNSIQDMSRVDLAEMVVDWKARSTEMGTDLRDWIRNRAMEKYNFNSKTKQGKEINYFVKLLLDAKF